LARILLGNTFLLASVDKIAYPHEFKNIIMSYNILPKEYAPLFSYSLPYIELVFGVLLIIGLFRRTSALVLSFLLSIFIIAIVVKSFSGNIGNCGCIFFSSANLEISAHYLILRNLALLLMGAIIVNYKDIKQDTNNITNRS
jgi:uncharacterized membrane protein YphA (DoxX/SURF4 family)